MIQPPASMLTDPIYQLQQWYIDQCNGDWEHTYGVKIGTLDNPGWMLEVDLWETELQGQPEGRLLRERSDCDWVDIQLSNSKFIATGGANNLVEMVELFLSFVKNGSLDSSSDDL